jgi:hypothetical protein
LEDRIDYSDDQLDACMAALTAATAAEAVEYFRVQEVGQRLVIDASGVAREGTIVCLARKPIPERVQPLPPLPRDSRLYDPGKSKRRGGPLPTVLAILTAAVSILVALLALKACESIREAILPF